MSFWEALGFKAKPKGDLKAKLPGPNSLVECAVLGGATLNVTVEGIGPKALTTTAPAGLAAGATVVLTYANPAGKFRLSTKVASVRGNVATLPIPARIDTLSRVTGGAQKRSSVRLDTTVPSSWRYASQGKGYGEFYRGSLTDLSRTGASLVADRELRKNATVEVKVQLSSGAPPLMLLGEVMRVGKIEQSGKSSHGLRFQGVSPTDDKAIMEFINRRQADRRNRGLM